MSSADLGTFEVSADAAEVVAFRAAARLADERDLPFTYPIRWLALPQVRAAAMALVPEAGLVPFHESQTFDYARRLAVGARYDLAVEARRESAPDRLVIDGTIRGGDGSVVAKVETVLRLFATGETA